MRKELLLIAFLSQSTFAADPCLIEMGTAVGKVDKKTSYSSLEKSYGKKNLEKAGFVFDREAGEVPGTSVTDPECGPFTVFWKDKQRKAPAQIVFQYVAKWHTKSGVKSGTTLEDLVKLNGKPVQFYGFDWDGEGVVNSWNEGKLEKELAPLWVRLMPERDSLGDKGADWHKALSEIGGDTLKSSDNPAFKKVKVSVEAISMSLE